MAAITQQVSSEREAGGRRNRAAARTGSGPVLCTMLVAATCFGAARLHAAAGFGPETSADPIETRIATTTSDFSPDSFAPSAYADWSND